MRSRSAAAAAAAVAVVVVALLAVPSGVAAQEDAYPANDASHMGSAEGCSEGTCGAPIAVPSVEVDIETAGAYTRPLFSST